MGARNREGGIAVGRRFGRSPLLRSSLLSIMAALEDRGCVRQYQAQHVETSDVF